MHQHMGAFEVETAGPGLIEITGAVRGRVLNHGVADGLLTLYIRHTSASLLITENADPQVLADLEAFFRRLVPPGDPLFRHTAEGPDDMPAHVRAALTRTHLSVPVVGRQLALGDWQGLFLYEHRDRPHRRTVAWHLIGEPAPDGAM
jgi:secondary thiamine-phosphate synthase enzyme